MLLCSLFSFLCLSSVSGFEIQSGEKITIETPDGVILSALYRPPASSNKKTFVLLHGLGSSSDEWTPFMNKLVESGYGFLAYDARGHGKSTIDKKNRPVNYQQFGQPGPGSEWEKMPDDLDAVITFLNNTKRTPAKKIGLIGASLGANISLLYAAKNPNIALIVLLSPGLNYAGFESLGYIETIAKRPIEISASPKDIYAYQSSILLYQKIQSNKLASFLPGKSGHGVQMFDGKFDNQLLKWINRH
jgi:alpha-beta hydrolase superfamily lysophospholipase